MGKYDPIGNFLAAEGAVRVSMTFEEIERLLGSPLPPSARAHREWWANTEGSHIQAKAWLGRGYKTEAVDLAKERLVFVRTAKTAATRAPRQAVEPPRELPPGPTTASGLRRHPLIGMMKGMITIMPGVDITAPVDPAWGERVYGENAKTSDIVGGLDDDDR